MSTPPSSTHPFPQPIEIWGMGGTGNCMRALVVFHETNTPFILHPVELRLQEHKQADNLKRQPFGLTPSIRIPGQPGYIHESRGIARYIASCCHSPLIPPLHTRQRALMEQWCSLEQEVYATDLAALVQETVFSWRFWAPGPNPKTVARLVRSLSKKFDIMDRHLATNTYLCGDDVTLPDLYFLPWIQLMWLTEHKQLVESRTHVHRWWKQLSSRESWQKTREYDVKDLDIPYKQWIEQHKDKLASKQSSKL